MEFGLPAVPALVGVGLVGRDAGGAQCHGRGPEQRADDRLHHRARSPACGRRKRGAQNQDIGRSRGGHTTKIHLRTNSLGLPIAVTFSGGEVSDYKGYEP